MGISKSAMYLNTQLASVLYSVSPIQSINEVIEKGTTKFEGREAVFGKAEVEEGGHEDGRGDELLLLFGKV
jgi:hypothetical protein